MIRYLSERQTNPGKFHENINAVGLIDEYILRRMETSAVLGGHNGCVNSLQWDHTGEYLISGSDDQHINIYKPFTSNEVIQSFDTPHESNIFSTKFLSSDKIISCSAEGLVCFTDINTSVTNSFSCHTQMAYEVEPLNDNVFLSCSRDGTVNRYDLRIASSCDCIGCNRHTLIDINCSSCCKSSTGIDGSIRPISGYFGRSSFTNSFHILGKVGVTAISINRRNPNHLAVGCTDGYVKIYDMRKLNIVISDDISFVSAKSSNNAIIYDFKPSHLRYSDLSSSDGSDYSVSDVSEENEEEHISEEEVEISDNEQVEDEEEEEDDHKITAVVFDPGSDHLLVSYSGEHLYRINPSISSNKKLGPKKRKKTRLNKADGDIIEAYSGHRNTQTIIKEAKFCNFTGHCSPNKLDNRDIPSQLVISGSDDGRVYIWESRTERHAMNEKYPVVTPKFTWKADGNVVNCVQPHPFTSAIAFSGIDSSIKIFEPVGGFGCENEKDLIGQSSEKEKERIKELESALELNREDPSTFQGIPLSLRFLNSLPTSDVQINPLEVILERLFNRRGS
jgi:WD40 repeat protein